MSIDMQQLLSELEFTVPELPEKVWYHEGDEEWKLEPSFCMVDKPHGEIIGPAQSIWFGPDHGVFSRQQALALCNAHNEWLTKASEEHRKLARGLLFIQTKRQEINRLQMQIDRMNITVDIIKDELEVSYNKIHPKENHERSTT